MRKRRSIEPPQVRWSLPIIGHLYQISRDPIAFFDQCYKEYGKVFTVRMGRKAVTFFCDRDYFNEIFLANDSKFSFAEFLDALHVSPAFSDTLLNPIATVKPFIRSAINSNFGQLLINMNHELDIYIQKYKKECRERDPDVGTHLNDMMGEVFHAPVLKSLFGFEFSQELISAHSAFADALKDCCFSSYIFPPIIINWFMLRKVQRMRRKYVELMMPTVKKYLENPSESTSLLVRRIVDHEMKVNGRDINAEEKCQILLAFHFTISTTPHAFCTHVLKELSCRPDLWKRIRTELEPTDENIDSILKNETLHACAMEGGRVNANISILTRMTKPDSYVGPYYLGNVDMVTIPGALCFEGEAGKFSFKDARKYNPERFLNGNESEPLNPRAFWLWGVGTHSCPGRNISIAICKLFMVHIIHNFDVSLLRKTTRDYSTLNTLPLQTVELSLTPILNN